MDKDLLVTTEKKGFILKSIVNKDTYIKSVGGAFGAAVLVNTIEEATIFTSEKQYNTGVKIFSMNCEKIYVLVIKQIFKIDLDEDLNG